MEPIMNFLEQYWGYTLFGSLTLGTIITFVVTQIVSILKGKTKDKNLNTLLTALDDACAKLNEAQELCEQQEMKYQAQVQQHAASEKYLQEVISTMFKSISYLIIASRLPNEDKIELQSKFIELTNGKLEQYKEVVKDITENYLRPAVTEVKEEIADDVIATLQSAVKNTASLLDKYTKE